MLRNEECLRVKQWVVPAVNNNPLRQCGTSSLPSHYPLLTLLYSVYTDYTRHETILYPLLSTFFSCPRLDSVKLTINGSIRIAHEAQTSLAYVVLRTT